MFDSFWRFFNALFLKWLQNILSLKDFNCQKIQIQFVQLDWWGNWLLDVVHLRQLMLEAQELSSAPLLLTCAAVFLRFVQKMEFVHLFADLFLCLLFTVHSLNSSLQSKDKFCSLLCSHCVFLIEYTVICVHKMIL